MVNATCRQLSCRLIDYKITEKWIWKKNCQSNVYCSTKYGHYLNNTKNKTKKWWKKSRKPTQKQIACRNLIYIECALEMVCYYQYFVIDIKLQTIQSVEHITCDINEKTSGWCAWEKFFCLWMEGIRKREDTHCTHVHFFLVYKLNIKDSEFLAKSSL